MQFEIPEFQGNPLIARLPQSLADEERFKQLASLPRFDERERDLPLHLREQLVYIRLRSFFIPTRQQRRQAAHVDLMIRAGYAGRNIQNSEFISRLHHQREWAMGEPSGQMESTAVSMAVLGPSGMGKTTTLKRSLAAYPQVINHDGPSLLQQIVWLHLDCPSGGSPKQLCISFFHEVDRLVGTNYARHFCRLSTDHMLVKVRHVASLHAIGLLAIDEIQNLSRANVGQAHILAFLTSLVNIANVPVLMIGTMSAFGVLTSNFRIARRGEGLGSILCEPMELDGEWHEFTKTIFRFQWTNPPTAWTEDLSVLLWEESEGLIDIVIKLFTLAQMRAIRLGRNGKCGETMSAPLIQKVAQESFKLVRPMLDALRRKDWIALAKYDDLASFDMCVLKSAGSQWEVGSLPELETLVDRVSSLVEGQSNTRDMRAMLVASGLNDSQVRLVMRKIDEVRHGKNGRDRSLPARNTRSTAAERINDTQDASDDRDPPDGADLRVAASGTEDPFNSLKAAGHVFELPD